MSAAYNASIAIDVDDVAKHFTPPQSLVSALLRRRAPRTVAALTSVTFSIAAGELFGLLGPNGAGKTTLLKILTTLLEPDRGRVLIHGVDVARDPERAKGLIGLCPSDERSFYARLSGRANMEYFGALVGLHGTVLRERIDEAVAIVGLSEAIDRRFDGYSSGMRQRLTVARALLGDPAVLIFDEPTKAVDPVNAEAIRVLIRDELVGRRGKTVILATNLLHEAWALCHRIAVINRGSVVALDTPAALTAGFHTVVRYQAELDSPDDALFARLRGIPGLTLSVATTPAGCEVNVEVERSADALRAVMSAFAEPDVRLREFRSIEPEPVQVFEHITRVEVPR